MSESKPTYEQLQDLLMKTLNEVAELRRQLALRGDTCSVEYMGVRILVSPTAPPFVWNGVTISVLDGDRLI